MTIPRIWHTATLLPDGTVLIAGGYTRVGGNSSQTATTEIYDPATGSFTSGPTMKQGRFSHSATLLSDGRVLFVGGGLKRRRNSHYGTRECGNLQLSFEKESAVVERACHVSPTDAQ